MTKGTKGLPAAWRDALRDSPLDKSAKLVGLVLSTFLNGKGRAFPSLETLADGASVSRRTVWAAIARLELHGFLSVTRSRGRQSHRYLATLPVTTVQPLHGSEAGNRAIDDTQPCNFPARNGATIAPESALRRLKADAVAADFEVAASANGQKGGDEDMPSPFRLGLLAKAMGEPYWELFVIRPPDEPGWVGVYESLEAAEAERARLTDLRHVDGDYLEVREGQHKGNAATPRAAS